VDRVDDLPLGRVEGDVVQAERVAVDLAGAVCLPQPQGAAVAAEVMHHLAALALDRALALEAEPAEQAAIERQAAPRRRDADVDVVDEGAASD
jgi:hypothetical protein